MKTWFFTALLIAQEAIKVKGMHGRSIAIVRKFLLEYQENQRVTCTLNFLDTIVFDFGLMEDENFHIQSGHKESKTKMKTGCDIFICTSKFAQTEESKKIDRAGKDHLWIVDGAYSPKQFVWPVLEVKPLITKLYCLKDADPKLILQSKVQFCSEYPTWNGESMKVSMFGYWPRAFRGRDGTLMGSQPNGIELLSEFVKFKPSYIFGGKTYDDPMKLVQNGTVDLGIKISMTYKKNQLVDFPYYINFVEMIHAVQIPQPINNFYQFLQPFQTMVWIAWVTTLGLFGILAYLVAMLTRLQVANSSLNRVKLIDFVVYSFGLSIQPLIDHNWIKNLRSKTLSGALVILWLALSGFLVMNLYKTILLSHLTAKSYEKPIDTVKDLLDSDLRIHIFNDESSHFMKNDPRKEYQKLYTRVLENGWMVNDMAKVPPYLKSVYDGKASFMAPKFCWDSFLKRDIQTGRGILLRRVKEVYRSSPSSLTLPKNGPMTKTFGKFIVRAVDHGLFQKIEHQYAIREGEDNFNIYNSNPLTLF